ncbi:uncharacterized protein VTP21DRAFT_7977 [Calcarisporiella thermophila]|uniref:uncharacterized protein n=1 Tax=Calcarisporiella thermophila TaxID=911321 RepID=UPI003743FC41
MMAMNSGAFRCAVLFLLAISSTLIAAATINSTKIVQKNAPWHLARISHRKLTPNNKSEFVYNSNRDGRGVTVYVLDSGVDTKHVEFEGRARIGANLIEGDDQPDNLGHGTECASLVAGKTVGVAKKAQVVSVKITYRGNPRAFQAGLEFVLKDAKKNPQFKSVASISVGTEKVSQGLEDALTKLIEAGVTVVAAAGNGANDPCVLWPARRKDVITVAGSDINDNWGETSGGKCVDILAPSVDILSAEYNPREPDVHDKLGITGGSSDATPIVAGVVAGFLSEQPMSPAEVMALLRKTATKNAIRGIPPGTPNLLVYNDKTSQ